MATLHNHPEPAQQFSPEFAAEMRAKGYKQITHWVPDTENPDFVREYRRQVQALSERSEESGAEFWAWVESVQATEGWV